MVYFFLIKHVTVQSRDNSVVSISIVFQRVYIIDGLHWQFYFISVNIFHQSINTLSVCDATKILLPIIIEIMEDKVIETITYIKLVSKKEIIN